MVLRASWPVKLDRNNPSKLNFNYLYSFSFYYIEAAQMGAESSVPHFPGQDSIRSIEKAVFRKVEVVTEITVITMHIRPGNWWPAACATARVSLTLGSAIVSYGRHAISLYSPLGIIKTQSYAIPSSFVVVVVLAFCFAL